MEEPEFIVIFVYLEAQTMKPRILTTIFLCAFISLQIKASSQISRLDEAISKRDYYIGLKQHRIDSLKNLLSDRIEPDKNLALYNEMFREYLTFNFITVRISVH